MNDTIDVVTYNLEMKGVTAKYLISTRLKFDDAAALHGYVRIGPIEHIRFVDIFRAYCVRDTEKLLDQRRIDTLRWNFNPELRNIRVPRPSKVSNEPA
jgi:hypothetical protein